MLNLKMTYTRDIMYNDCIITPSDVHNAIQSLNPHKNDVSSALSTSHFINAGDDLLVHIGFLFSAIISHGAVPTDFGLSTILPIPKTKHASVVASDNFRGIAMSSIYVKLFDNIVIRKYYDKLCTSELQFGFKRNSSTHVCTMVLKETLSYYIKQNDSVFCTFLDASKAFDRVNYCTLFRTLRGRGLPPYIIRVLINMYVAQQARVSWAGVVSGYFPVHNGVRQGGVLSPVLFCVYIDNLLCRLSRSGVGCSLGVNYVGALAYADDIVLLCPTTSAMLVSLVKLIMCYGYFQ